MTFSDYLRALRDDESQERFAELMPEGFSVRTLQAWEAGRRLPSPWLQRLIIGFLQDRIAEHDAFRSECRPRRFR